MIKEKIKAAPLARDTLLPPKFKGRTKIELFEKGEKVQEHIDNNMMTNMLSKIFNPKRLFVDREYGYELYAYHTPMYNTVLGGLLLYEDAIEENAELSLAPMSNKCVGHAGSAYSGTQPTRGTLNESESGFINPDEPWKGYRYVWDFGTDKANGTISCACLTSRRGGNSGYGKGIDYEVTEDDNAFCSELCNTQSSSYTAGQTIYIKDSSSTAKLNMLNICYWRYLGTTDSGMSRFAYLATTSQMVYIEIPSEKLNLNFADEINSSGNRVIDLAYVGKDNPGYTVNLYTLPFAISGTYTASVFVKDGKYYIVSHTGSTSFDFCYFDPDTKTLSESESRAVSPAYAYSTANAVCKAGDYWWAFDSSKNLIRYPDAGGTGDIVGVLPAISNYGMCDADGNLGFLLLSSTSYIRIFDTDNPDNFFAKTTTAYSSAGSEASMQIDPDDNDAIVVNSVRQNSGSTPYSITASVLTCRLCGYTATINNLSTPVTKTSTQTMKITYEITPEEAE